MKSKPVKYNPYRQARYVISAHDLKQLPPDTGVEVAFAGRSNAGKSSAINTLTDQKSLARTSKTPGRTQQIIIFDIDDMILAVVIVLQIIVDAYGQHFKGGWFQKLPIFFNIN